MRTSIAIAASPACRAVAAARHRRRPGVGRNVPPAGARRRAAPPPANYPPYTRPVSTYVPPRTPDGQPDISGLYLAIPLPRSIETPLVPVNRAPNRANGEFSFSLNERPKLPEGAMVRPVGVDPPDGKIPLTPEALARRKDIIANQEKIEHLDGRVLCLAPGVPRTTIPAPVVGYQIFQKPGYVVIFYEQSHLYRTIPLDGRPPLDPNIRKAMGVSRGRWEGNTLVVEVTNFTNNSQQQLGHRRGLRDARHSRGVADDRSRHSAQRSVSRDRTLHADRRQHDPLRSQDRRSEGVHAAVDDRVLRVRARAEGLRAGRIRVLRRKRQEPAPDDEHRHHRHPRQRALTKRAAQHVCV